MVDVSGEKGSQISIAVEHIMTQRSPADYDCGVQRSCTVYLCVIFWLCSYDVTDLEKKRKKTNKLDLHFRAVLNLTFVSFPISAPKICMPML